MTASTTDTSPVSAPHRVRPFYWSVRREIWENRGVYLAPLGVAAIVLFGVLFALRHVPQQIRNLVALTADLKASAGIAPAALVLKKVTLGKAVGALVFPYAAAGGGLMITAMVFAVFYALASLHAERRERSILFWKSLPVSDLATVLSKAAIPLLILPVVTAVVALATHAIMLALETAILAANGLDPSLLWDRLDLGMMWTAIPYGLAVLALWHAPIVAWLMLVSAWAKRMAILWAVGPVAAICLFERLALGTSHAWDFLRHRLVSGFSVGFAAAPAGHASVYGAARANLMQLLTNPGLWGGFVVAAACLAGCVWLRRTRDPI
jgi:ABC-2 type transport system permease protein